MDRPAAYGGRLEVPREGQRLQGRDGRTRTLQGALPRVRFAGPTDSLRRQRGELLRDVPDRRSRPGRSVPFETAQRGLAEVTGRLGGEGWGQPVTLRRATLDDAS